MPPSVPSDRPGRAPRALPSRLRLLAVPLLLLPLAACDFVAGSPLAAQCDVTGQRGAEVDASGAASLAVTAGAGSLEIRGRSDLDRVRVAGEACASSESLLEAIGLEARREGDRVVVAARMPDTEGWERAELDLVLEVPSSLTVKLDDGSGPITVRDVAGLDVTDGSGSLEVRGIAGPVRIDDGSGSIDLAEVRGALRLHDGSGSIEISSVEGDVVVEDGSGGLTIRRVRGSVRIDDGSGGISVVDVTGDLVVEEAGSGSLEIERVAGQVSIEE